MAGATKEEGQSGINEFRLGGILNSRAIMLALKDEL